MNLTPSVYRTPAQAADDATVALVPSSRPSQALARMLVAFFAVAAVLLTVVPWQQTVTGNGRVVAFAPRERQQTVEAPIEGRLMHQRVREGERVRAGDVLADILDNDPMLVDRLREERAAVLARKTAAESRREAIESRLGQLGNSRESAVGAAGNRIRMARERLRQSEQSLAASEALLDTARRNLDRQESLGREGLASTRAVELALLDKVRAETEVLRARAAVLSARSEVDALGADQSRVGADGLASMEDARAARALAEAEIANAAAELARIDVRLARQAAQQVRAPRDGTVLRWLAGAGAELVKAGDPLLVFVPDTDARAVELWVDGNDVPLLREGRAVRIQFEGWPALQFSGWPSAAVGTFGGRVAVIDAADNGQGKFRVLVVPDGRERWPAGALLRQGVRANGFILLDRVRLGWELWRQFNGFPPVVAPAEPGSTPARGGK